MLYTLEEHTAKKLVSAAQLNETASIAAKISEEKVNVLQASASNKTKRKLIVKMEAIHTGRTKNFT